MNAEKPAPTDHPIEDVIAERWSARAIDASKPVARGAIMSMLEAARWAPSCYGEEPWRFLIADRGSDSDAWVAIADALADGNRKWAMDAPVLIVTFANKTFSRNGKPNRWAQYDTGAAAVSLHMQGVAEGLVVHQMGGFDANAVGQAFDVPQDCEPMAVIAIGHPAEPETLEDEGLRKQEVKPRERRELGEIAFTGQWGRAIS